MKSLKLQGNFKIANLTRVEVIDDGGRNYVNRKDELSVEISIQDDGKTMKIFLHDKNLCKFCGGQGSYYEDVVGDGGSRMEIPCDECNAGNPLIDENE